MWLQRNSLACLHEELRIIELFDRVHAYSPDPNPTDNGAYAFRQIRRSEIMAEISKLKTSKAGYRSLAQISGAFILLYAVGFATFHYLLK